MILVRGEAGDCLRNKVEDPAVKLVRMIIQTLSSGIHDLWNHAKADIEKCTNDVEPFRSLLRSRRIQVEPRKGRRNPAGIEEQAIAMKNFDALLGTIRMLPAASAGSYGRLAGTHRFDVGFGLSVERANVRQLGRQLPSGELLKQGLLTPTYLLRIRLRLQSALEIVGRAQRGPTDRKPEHLIKIIAELPPRFGCPDQSAACRAIVKGKNSRCHETTGQRIITIPRKERNSGFRSKSLPPLVTLGRFGIEKQG